MSLDVLKGAVDQSVEVRVLDSTDGTPEAAFAFDTAGIALWYRREGGAKVAITPADLAALTTAHTDGGVKYISDGYVRIDVPDAAFATGATSVVIGGSATGMVIVAARVNLVSFNPQDAVRLGLTALPNAAADAAGGLPISDAGGLDLDAKIGALTFGTANRVNAQVYGMESGVLTAAAIAADAFTAAKFADDCFVADNFGDDCFVAANFATGAFTADVFASGALAGQAVAPIARGTAQGGDANTLIMAASEGFGTNFLNGNVVKILSGTGAGQARVITSNVQGTDTLNISPAWTTSPSSDSVYEIEPASVNLSHWLGAAVTVNGSGTPKVDVVAWLGTTVATPATAGVPSVDVVYVSGDSTAANNLEAAADGTGYNLGGGSIVAASVTGNVGGNVVGSVGSVTVVSDKTGYALSATGANLVLVAGVTLPEAIRRIGTITSGEVSGAGTGTETFEDWAGSANTIVITVDSSGNRTAITYN